MDEGLKAEVDAALRVRDFATLRHVLRNSPAPTVAGIIRRLAVEDQVVVYLPYR